MCLVGLKLVPCHILLVIHREMLQVQRRGDHPGLSPVEPTGTILNLFCFPLTMYEFHLLNCTV